ncbi:uncharacterized protein TEOVI_000635500 [Trypanosoma equiperdum]|uniref:Uncharacterized protein n=2 Tax=Trypanozoon TaxID=39700 RepID=Q584U0_TRYB2|nr:hypothetical protein, conserved [Trypanosoma brucei brucei TREU927]AAX80849.1 hypothetical protein, conserved [Trypanosoma brucei]AAZ11778.1 hypothetical protein, conserved [Trypanosoma brucei brucei TREU927]SCU66662.1 hypothetical protein, conserved [Trypanosoma equiperdum]
MTMRRFGGALTRPLGGMRRVVVGPNGSVPEAGCVPTFETRRRKRLRLGGSLTGDWVASTESLSGSCVREEEARLLCFEKYGFVHKPLTMASWSDFLQELARFEFRWRLLPCVGGVTVLNIVERNCGDENVLCDLRTSCGSAPFAQFFECLGAFVQGTSEKRCIMFCDPNGLEQSLEIRAKRHLSPALGEGFEDEKPILPTLAQYDCRGTLVDLVLKDMKTDVLRPIISDISMQALNYAFLVSIPLFLRQADVGVRNTDLVSKEQMRHFRFAWCFLRRESMMTPVEIGELDTLLPP